MTIASTVGSPRSPHGAPFLGRRKPQGGVRDVLVEGRMLETEGAEPGETSHQAPPLL